MKSILDFNGCITAGDIERMIAKGANPNVRSKSGSTPFMMATCFGYTSAAEALFKAGADINGQDDHGNTALMLAAYAGMTGVIKTLKQFGVNFNLQDKKGGNALSSVIDNVSMSSEKAKEVLHLLLEFGAEPTTENLSNPIISEAYQNWKDVNQAAGLTHE